MLPVLSYDHSLSLFIVQVGKLKSILCLDCTDDYLYSYDRWMRLVEKDPPTPIFYPKESDLATIIYTSGTTGNIVIVFIINS